jgi:hypothetical protein
MDPRTPQQVEQEMLELISNNKKSEQNHTTAMAFVAIEDNREVSGAMSSW